MLYRSPGNIVDWMYKRAGIKYSYAVHLRDTGTVRCVVFFSYHLWVSYLSILVWILVTCAVDQARRRGDWGNDRVSSKVYCQANEQFVF
jgi:hypothetical protein